MLYTEEERRKFLADLEKELSEMSDEEFFSFFPESLAANEANKLSNTSGKNFFQFFLERLNTIRQRILHVFNRKAISN
jgi:hypothetical protein